MDSTYGQEYATLYRHHWWWRARESIVLQEIARFSLPRPARILDFGCGDGLLLPQLERFGTVCGLEADASLISADNPYRNRIETRLLSESQIQHERFDLITALDVLEHIEDDRYVLANLVAMLKPGGKLLITVPASMLLWDRHDEINHHYRRYTKSSFSQIVSPAAIVSRCKYLFHSLFALKLAVGLWNRCLTHPVAQHKLPPTWINSIAHHGLLWEQRFTGWASIPFGTSLLAVLEQRPTQDV